MICDENALLSFLILKSQVCYIFKVHQRDLGAVGRNVKQFSYNRFHN